MGRLIILSRPGVQIVSGTVIGFDNSSITIENNVHFANGKVEKRHCTLISGQASTLKLKLGAEIIASVKSKEELIALNDGAYLKETPIYTEAYTIRYTGSFDFEQYGEEKESHVFCANILNIMPIKKGGCLITIVWKKKGETIKKTLYSPKLISYIKKGIFITGAEKDSSFGPVYVIKGIAI